MNRAHAFLAEHRRLTRRFFVRLGVVGTAAAAGWPLVARGDERPAELAKAIQSLESFFTPPEKFRDVSRGKPLPHSLPEEKKTRSRPCRARPGSWR